VDGDDQRDAAEVIDAAIVIDAPPDAAPLPCTVDGLVGCGTATLFMCGDHCWVRCSNGATRTQASTTCVGWQGALGQIDDMTEQTCVASRVGNISWIGLVQSDAATAPADGWLWNTDANPVLFTNWQSNRPDDRDGVENRTEQCGMIQSDARWDDVACTEQHPFFCER
jgi:hypothetical protein